MDSGSELLLSLSFRTTVIISDVKRDKRTAGSPDEDIYYLARFLIFF
ncbi:unnamed protein product [Brugia pahangi]|uniref:Uncharacterized protein n=1 Tax=Brugia pahangi TaxID=6280 RepID=A0A0N4TD46_BRUPA|nr:unnamed protein product [Brugia pahangi]